eukprot:6034792-Lingulodinium_polyedra.AAC.1
MMQLDQRSAAAEGRTSRVRAFRAQTRRRSARGLRERASCEPLRAKRQFERAVVYLFASVARRRFRSDVSFGPAAARKARDRAFHAQTEN